jgi:hypothetical protein
LVWNGNVRLRNRRRDERAVSWRRIRVKNWSEGGLSGPQRETSEFKMESAEMESVW